MAFLEVVVKNFTENLSSKMANGSLKKEKIGGQATL